MFHPDNRSAGTSLLLAAGAAAALLATAACRPPAGEGAASRPAESPARTPAEAEPERTTGPTEDDVTRTYGKDDREITATVGERFVIALEANPATGYEWTAEVEGNRLRPVDRSIRRAAPGPESAPLGAPVVEEFTFEALSEGESSIRLEYRRPWEEETLETLVFRVRAAPPEPRSP